MNPSTSTIATGSLKPDSPSSVRARRRSMLDPRSTEKIAALSVQATIEPSSRPSSVVRSSSQEAVRPTIAAVITVPTVASDRLTPSTGRISPQPAASPPSNRISASAMMPIVLGQLHVLDVAAEVDQPEHVGADQHAQAEHQQQAGHAQPPGHQRGGDAEGQQPAGDQDEGAVLHRPSLWTGLG